LNGSESSARGNGGAARSPRAVAAVFLGALGIAFAPVFIKTSEVRPVTTAFWRLFLSLPFFWTMLALQSRRDRSRGGASGGLRVALPLMVPGLFFACDLAVWHWSLQFTSAANSTLLVNMAPILVTIVGWVWLRERFTWLFVAGLVIACGGSVFVVGSGTAQAASNPLLGDALALSTAFFYAGYQVAAKVLRRRFTVMRIMAWSSTSATVCLLVMALASGESLLPRTLAGWQILIGLVISCQICGQGLIVYGLAHLPAGFSSVTLLIQPIAAALLAWALLGEQMLPAQYFAGPIVLCGILLARFGSLPPAPRPAPDAAES